MDYAQIEIRITDHAYEAYCDRVEKIDRVVLKDRCRQHLINGNRYRRNQFLQLDGVWWITHLEGNRLIFITCYGKSNMDMPRAIAWAARHNDRIVLDPVQHP